MSATDDIERFAQGHAEEAGETVLASVSAAAHKKLLDPKILRTIRQAASSWNRRLRKVDSAIEEDDLFHSAIVKILREPRHLEHADDPHGYAWTLVSNLALDLIRRRRMVTSENATTGHVGANESALTAEEVVWIRQVRDLKGRALASMSGQEREVFLAVENEEAIKSIASRIGLSVGGVEAALRRARRKYRQLIDAMPEPVRTIALVTLLVPTGLLTTTGAAEAALILTLIKHSTRIARVVAVAALILFCLLIARLRPWNASNNLLEQRRNRATTLTPREHTIVSTDRTRIVASHSVSTLAPLTAGEPSQGSDTAQVSWGDAAAADTQFDLSSVNNTFAVLSTTPHPVSFDSSWGPTQPLVLRLHQEATGDGALIVTAMPSTVGAAYQCAGVRRLGFVLVQCIRPPGHQEPKPGSILMLGLVRSGALYGNAWYGSRDQGHVAASSWSMGGERIARDGDVGWWRMPVLQLMHFLCAIPSNVPACRGRIGTAEYIPGRQVSINTGPGWRPVIHMTFLRGEAWSRVWTFRIEQGPPLEALREPWQRVLFGADDGVILDITEPERGWRRRSPCSGQAGAVGEPFMLCINPHGSQ